MSPGENAEETLARQGSRAARVSPLQRTPDDGRGGEHACVERRELEVVPRRPGSFVLEDEGAFISGFSVHRRGGQHHGFFPSKDL